MFNNTLIRVVSFCVASLFLFAPACIADISEIRYEDVLNVVKSCEKEIHALRWKVRMEITTLPIAGQSGQTQGFEKSPAFAEVLLDFHAKRFKVEEKKQEYGVMRDNSVVKYMHEESSAYDGSNYSAWKRNTHQKPGTDLYQGSSGEIIGDFDSSVVARQFLEGGGLAAVGFRTGVPCFFLPDFIKSETKFFSEFLAEWKENRKLIALFRQNDGDIIIYAKIYPEYMGQYVAKIVYSPGKKGIITEYSTLLSYSNETGDGESYACWLTRCKQSQGGDWVPTTVFLSMPLLGPNGYNTELHYEDFEYLPKIPVEEFRVDFPIGAEVSDHVAKMFYKVGDPIDEDRAIDDFIQLYGFTGDVPSHMRHWNVLRYVLMGIGIFMILIALYRIIQRWRKKQ